MENTENIVPEAQTEDTTQSWSFVTDEEAAAGMAAQQEAPVETQEPEVQQEVQAETPVEAPVDEPQVEQPVQEAPSQETVFDATTDDFVTEQQEDTPYSDQDLESAVFEYLSERLGRQVGSIEDLTAAQQQERQLDERIAAIAQFVEETGRSPQDWFLYQQFNPSEMDDMTAIQVQMASDYPNLSQEEIGLLVGSKYKLDTDLHTEDEIRLSKLQLKMDAEAARKGISSLRETYRAPEVAQQPQAEDSDLFDEQWMTSMRESVNDFQGVEFDLGGDKTFRFGLGNQYKASLAEKQSRLDEYFDPYVREDGSWDYDTLNVHRTILDNFETIAKSIYQQGMSDGKRGIVDQAANVSVQTPNQGNVPETNSLSQQLREAMSGGDKMRTIF
jgi:hypothetical protein